MSVLYNELQEYISQLVSVNCHTHHMPDDFFSDFGLDELLNKSYVQWCGETPGTTRESRDHYLDRVSYKSYFRSLQRGIMSAYNIKEELSSKNWNEYDRIIRNAHKDQNWHLELLESNCSYETSILDAYWNPGSNNGHPDLFAASYRFSALLFAGDESDVDHNGFGAWKSLGWQGGSLEKYLDLVEKVLAEAKKSGVCALKNALPYDRGIDYGNPSREEAQQLLLKKKPTIKDKLNFQDYILHHVADIAAELELTIQCHTGMGKLHKTRAIHMLDMIRRHPKTRFSLMHGGFPWTTDIIAFLDLFPNVYADVCWLPMLSPTAAVQMLHQLIEAGTSNRIVFGCDSWTGEESLGARITMNQVLAKVLSQKVADGYFPETKAKQLSEKIMYHNAKVLFSV